MGEENPVDLTEETVADGDGVEEPLPEKPVAAEPADEQAGAANTD